MNIEKLKEQFHLSHKVAINVPNTKNVNEKFDNEEYITKTLTMFSRFFGGASAVQLDGAWWSDTKIELVRENPTQIYSNCDEASLNAHLDEIITFCEWMCEELTQDAIYLEIDGSAYFIEAKL